MKEWVQTIDNMEYIFIVGSNKEENQYLINNSQQHDLWFHIANYPSCHVVCKMNPNNKLNKKHLNKIIKQGALCCKMHSKYKHLQKLDITYATIRQLENTETVGSVIVHNGKTIAI